MPSVGTKVGTYVGTYVGTFVGGTQGTPFRSIELAAFTSEIAVDGSGGELDVTDEYTLIMRMRIVSRQPWSTNYMDKGNEATANFKQSSNQQFRFDVKSTRASFSTSTDYRDRVRDGRWHTVAVSWTAAGGAVFVVDGVERTPDSNNTDSAGAITDTLSDLVFAAGVNTGATATTTVWRLYDAYWYDAALDVATIQALTAAGNFSNAALVASIDASGVEGVGGLDVTQTATSLVDDTPSTGDRSTSFAGAAILHITGQSLATGESSGSAVTPIPSGASTRWRINDDNDGFQQIEAGAGTEPPEIGMAWGWQSETDEPVVVCQNALSGSRMDQIDKPSGTYTALLAGVTACHAAIGTPQRYVAIINGETDETDGTTEAAYEAALSGWLSDLDADLKAVTGQTQDVWAIVSQVSRQANGTLVIGKAQYDVCKAQSRAVLSGAKYHHTYVDNVHLDARSSKAEGVQLARVARELEATGSWQPLWPTSVAINGNDIEITLNVPSGNVVKDTTTIPAQTDDGFEYLNGAGAEAISSVSISGGVITITMDSAPSPSASIAYAYSSSVLGAGVTGSARGNIRTDRAIYASLDVTYAASESVTATINGTDFTVSCDTDDATTAQALVDSINAGSEPVQAEKDLSGLVSIFADDRRTTFTFASSATGSADIDARVEWDWLVHFVEALS